jgi:hypothetical protein
MTVFFLDLWPGTIADGLAIASSPAPFCAVCRSPSPLFDGRVTVQAEIYSCVLLHLLYIPEVTSDLHDLPDDRDEQDCDQNPKNRVHVTFARRRGFHERHMDPTARLFGQETSHDRAPFHEARRHQAIGTIYS